MLNCNLLENLEINLSCFTGKNKSHHEIDRKIYNVSQEYNISILPIIQSYELDNLYPPTDHVELWNIFIVGSDKTYILANVKDEHIKIPNANLLPNKTGVNLLPEGLQQFMDSIWDKTLCGKKLQFYMTWNFRLYFINTYPFHNNKDKVIGAVMFMRAHENMPHMMMNCAIDLETNKKPLKSRKSADYKPYGSTSSIGKSPSI
jgi:hypothetical protein